MTETSHLTLTGARQSADRQTMLALDEPVVVLTGPRSGSTILRVLLNAHPELACPPETNIVKACAILGKAWQLTDPSSTDSKLSRLASASLRASVNAMFTDHLLRSGKRRWCDKSLGTVYGLNPFVDLYPKTKFICLYRHCMDVINSGLEASPFGLLGYGYESYAMRFNGNNVAAIAAAWCEETTLALDWEEKNPGLCHRIYYETLVENPERVTADLFSFLGVEPAPGLSDRCFDVSHDFSGPGDYKVTATSRINTDSVGRGIRVPLDLLPPSLLDMMNSLLSRLGYAAVDDDWKRSLAPPGLLPHRDRSVTVPLGKAPDKRSAELLDRLGVIVNERLGKRLPLPVPRAAVNALGPAKRIGIAAYRTGSATVTRCWQLDLNSRTATSGDYVHPAHEPRVDWLMSGDARTWLSLLSGEENIAVSMRARDLRHVHMAAAGASEITAVNKNSSCYLAMIKHLLALDEPLAAYNSDFREDGGFHEAT